MIVLDTNVVSEAMKLEPDIRVREWLDTALSEDLFLTSITQAELSFGVMQLPDGKKKDGLATALGQIEQLFTGRILPFDSNAAKQYAQLAYRARQAGKGFPSPDSYIAAIAASHGFRVATRDTGPFLAAEIEVVNPWEYTP
jgi:toxin FitB